MDRRTLLGAGIGASLLGTGVLGAAPAFASPAVGKPAPKFTLHTFDRQKITLADLAGKVIVLNYWATWCGPCKLELPLIDAYVRHKGGGDLKVFAITVDNTVSDYELKPLADVLSFPLISKIDSWSYGDLGAIPTNYVIDRSGILRYAKAAAFTTVAAFDAVVGPLLAEAPPAAGPAATAS